MAGIFRDVYLVSKAKVHIKDYFVTTPFKENGNAEFNLKLAFNKVDDKNINSYAVLYELIDSENKKINRKITDILPAVLKVEEVLTKKGVNTFRATVEYKFDDKYKTVINDTISFDVEVH